MQTEPEQWAVELFIAAVAQWWRQTDRSDYGPAALTIQRAFEERERKLRETGQFLLDRLVDHEVRMTSDKDGREWLGHVAPAMARFRQALKETPDAQ